MKELFQNHIVQGLLSYLGVLVVAFFLIRLEIKKAWIVDEETGLLIDPKTKKENDRAK